MQKVNTLLKIDNMLNPYKGEIYTLTSEGYRVADQLKSEIK